MDKRKWIIFFSSFCLIVTIGCNFVSVPFGLRINDSDSLPYRLFFSVMAGEREIERGTIVSFKHHLSSENLAKQVVGLPGDYITVRGNHVYINGKDAGALQAETSQGVKLTPAKEGRIEPGYFFVVGTHERSFDSRYADFGLVPRDSIVELLWPLF